MSRLEEMFVALGIESDNEHLLALINKYLEKSHPELKALMRVLIDMFTKDD